MFYLYGYQDIKRFDEEKRARSLARLSARGGVVPDSYMKPQPEAEIVEIVFGTRCDRIGA